MFLFPALMLVLGASSYRHLIPGPVASDQTEFIVKSAAKHRLIAGTASFSVRLYIPMDP
jgi:hypothetical protein